MQVQITQYFITQIPGAMGTGLTGSQDVALLSQQQWCHLWLASQIKYRVSVLRWCHHQRSLHPALTFVQIDLRLSHSSAYRCRVVYIHIGGDQQR